MVDTVDVTAPDPEEMAEEEGGSGVPMTASQNEEDNEASDEDHGDWDDEDDSDEDDGDDEDDDDADAEDADEARTA